MKQNSSSIDWDLRFSIQAEWTKPLRNFLSTQLGISKYSKVLEVGSGTGVILRDTEDFSNCAPFGIDFDFSRLILNKSIQPNQNITCAFANKLPFASNTFDFVISHYFFLWLKEPIKIMNEVFRVLKPNGIAIAYAEPDYEGRIEYPSEFDTLGKLQNKSLSTQGVDIETGRKLPGFFSKAGFIEIQLGMSGFQKKVNGIDSNLDSEWEIIKDDIAKSKKNLDLENLKSLDFETRKNGTRVSWVPTFYAFGRKP